MRTANQRTCLSITHPQPYNRRVMVARPFPNSLRPRVHMYMFDVPATPCDRVRHKDLVDLLRVLVVRIRVPFRGGYARDIIRIVQQRSERTEHGTGGGKFVHVTRDDHWRVCGEVEERGDEALVQSMTRVSVRIRGIRKWGQVRVLTAVTFA